MRFTDKHIQALKPKEKPYVVTAESESRGIGRLQLKIYPTGTKKFQFQYYLDGRKRMEIGTYGTMTLANARKRFLKLSDIVQDGLNPKAEAEQENIIKTKLAAQKTMLQLVADFLLFTQNNWAPSTAKRTKYSVDKNLIPFIEPNKLPNEFTPDNARELIYKVYNRGAKEQANIFRSTLLSLFKFAIDFDNSPEQFKKENIYNVQTNPIRDISFDYPKKSGERWLSEKEIFQLWHSETLPRATKLYIQLALALAGQRVWEVYHSIDTEFDLKDNTFTIPVERVKIRSRGEHVVPLSPLAKSILKEILLTRGSNGQLWPHRDKKEEFAHVSTLRMAFLRWCDDNKVKRFTTRDLRRTCKTLMGKAGISKESRDLLQQHDKRNDVSSKNYDRYDYINEKREAMQQWTEYLIEITRPKK